MNYAKLNKSPRLNRVYDLLASGREYSTLDIVKMANVCAVNSIVAELRENGCKINCVRRGDVWYYQMETEAKAA